MKTPDVPKNENGHIQMIRMGKSIQQKWVKLTTAISRNKENPRHATYSLLDNTSTEKQHVKLLFRPLFLCLHDLWDDVLNECLYPL